MEIYNAHDLKTRFTVSMFDLNMIEVALAHILHTGNEIEDFHHYRDYNELLLSKIQNKIEKMETKYEDEIQIMMEMNTDDLVPAEL